MDGAAEQTTAPPSWREVWQVPAAVGAVTLLAAGILTAVLTAPEPDYVGRLDAAAGLVDRGRYEEGLSALNATVAPFLGQEVFSDADRARFHLARARAIYLGQEELGISIAQNNRSVEREYRVAVELGAEVDVLDDFRLARTLIALSEFEQAEAVTRRLPLGERDLRNQLLREMVDGRLRSSGSDYAGTIATLAEYLAEPGLGVDDRAWAEARQARLLLRHGYVDDTIKKLLRTLPRMEDASGAVRGELLLLLGRAYFLSGASGEADEQLTRAGGVLPEADPLQGEVLALRGWIAVGRGDLAGATEMFGRSVDQFEKSGVVLTARLGLAESLAAQRDDTAAFRAYGELIDELRGGREEPGVDRDVVGHSLLARYEDRSSDGALREALQYAGLAVDLFGQADTPAEVHHAVAEGNRRLADSVLGVGGGLESIARLDPATREVARRHLVLAGDAYREHANAVVIDDAEAYGRSLWLAGDCFDLAGDQDEAIRAFEEYVTGFSNDARQPEARYRLAVAHQSRGEYDLAAAGFEGLIADAADSGAAVGPWADRSTIPLAQVYLADDATENDEQAERLLLAAASGGQAEPGTERYRDAVVELGRMYYTSRRYPAAIEQLRRAAALFKDDEGHGAAADHGAVAHPADTHAPDHDRGHAPDHAPVRTADHGGGHGASGGTDHGAGHEPDHGPQPAAGHAPIPAGPPSGVQIRYWLADANRLEAAAIEVSLRDAMPDHERRALEETRRDRLAEAMAEFGLVREAIDARPPGARSVLDELYLRNASFYLGDAAFSLGDYEAAIRHYDAAREQYPRDPASLVAMIQIINAYLERGDTDRARNAHVRARRFFESLPPEVWDDPNLPMSNADWQRWLDSSARLLEVAAVEPAG